MPNRPARAVVLFSFLAALALGGCAAEASDEETSSSQSNEDALVVVPTRGCVSDSAARELVASGKVVSLATALARSPKPPSSWKQTYATLCYENAKPYWMVEYITVGAMPAQFVRLRASP